MSSQNENRDGETSSDKSNASAIGSSRGGRGPSKWTYIFLGIGIISAQFIFNYLDEQKEIEKYRDFSVYQQTMSGDKIASYGGDAKAFEIPYKLTNPELSWWQKIACLGYRKASFCSSKPMHPLAKYLEEAHGIDYSSLIEQVDMQNERKNGRIRRSESTNKFAPNGVLRVGE